MAEQQKLSPEGPSPEDGAPSNNNAKEQKENGDGFKQRKRMRVPTSCSVCRKRKIKCDKGKPACSSCAKSNVGHLCHYEEPSWISSAEILKHAKPVGSVNAGGASAGTPGDSVYGADTDSPASADLPPSVQNKIESLKDKIKQLEASIAVTELSRSTPPMFNNSNYGQIPAGAIQLPQPQPQQPLPFSIPQPPSQPQQSSPLSNNYQYASQSAPPPPLFNPQPFAQPSFQPSTSSLTNVPPISEGPKYDDYLSKRVKFFDYLPFIIKKRRLESHGPASFLASLRKDNYLLVLWTHIWKNLEELKQQSEGNGKHVCPFDAQEDDPLNSDGSKCSLSYKELKKEKMTQKVSRLNSVGSSIEQTILDVLPTRKVMMILIFRFFKFVYPLLPFLDEGSFLFEIDGIIGQLGFKDNKIEKLHIQNKYDFAIVGLLLLVLKLAHLSISEKEFEEKEDLKDLKNFQFNPNLITAVHLCLDQYKYWRKPFSLRLMQLLIYIKFYYKFCNEDDDVCDGSENQIMLGSLFSSAYALGLHRDPDELVTLANSVKKKAHAQLWRRIWYKLLEMDANQSMTLGLPLHIIDDRSYDTKLPFLDGQEDDNDRYLIKDFKFCEEKSQLFRDIYQAIGNIKNPPSVLDLIHLIRKSENFAQFKIGSLKDILSDTTLPNFARIKKICYLFEVTSVTLYLNTNLFRHFEDQKNTKQAYKYLEDVLQISLKIVNTAMNLAFNEEIYVGKGFAFYFRANAGPAIFRAFFNLSSIALRIIQGKAMVKETDIQRYELLKEFLDVICYNLENCLQLLTKMSVSHYNFTRLVTAFRMIYHKMKDPGFDFDKAAFDLLKNFASDNNVLHNHLQSFTPDRIPKSNFLLDLINQEISKLIETSNSNLVSVLQPAVRKNDSINNQLNHPSSFNPSGAGGGSFYDPVDGYTKRASESGESSSFNLSPSAINQNNIFNIDSDDLHKLLNPPNIIDTQRVSSGYMPNSNVLSSEEYASLFGIFDEYGPNNDFDTNRGN